MENFYIAQTEFNFPPNEKEAIFDWAIKESVDRYLRRRYMVGVIGHYRYDLGVIYFDHIEGILLSRFYPKLDQIFRMPVLHTDCKVMVVNDTIVIGK